MKKALISGISGQAGYYLSELLLQNNYLVYGIVRRFSSNESQLHKDIIVHYGDITDQISIEKIMEEVKPDEIYHLAGQSSVKMSSNILNTTAQVNAIGTLNMLEAFKNYVPNSRFLNASSGEMFGNNVDVDGFQRETTAFNPVSPYGISKTFAHQMAVYYRNTYKLFISNSISFNQESPRRNENFISAKIVKGAIEIAKGVSNKLLLGDLESYRDWSHSKDCCEAMFLILQHYESDDFIISSMESHSVKEIVEYVFGKLTLDWTKYVVQNSKFMRAEDTKRPKPKGDSMKIRKTLGWTPKYNFYTLLDEMIKSFGEKYEIIV